MNSYNNPNYFRKEYIVINYFNHWYGVTDIQLPGFRVRGSTTSLESLLYSFICSPITIFC